MTQTVLAALAMMMAMLFALNQQQGIVHEYKAMVHDEMEIMAGGVALDAMETMASKPFDEAVMAPGYDEDYFTVSALAPWPFPTGGTFGSADFLEDFHEIQTDTVDFQVGGVTFTFNVDVYVHYVDATKQHSTNKTDTKEVLVTVAHARYEQPLVRLSRSFSP